MLGLKNEKTYDFLLDLVYSFERRKNREINISLKLLRLVTMDELNKEAMKNEFAIGAAVLRENVERLVECLLEMGSYEN